MYNPTYKSFYVVNPTMYLPTIDNKHERSSFTVKLENYCGLGI